MAYFLSSKNDARKGTFMRMKKNQNKDVFSAIMKEMCNKL